MPFQALGQPVGQYVSGGGTGELFRHCSNHTLQIRPPAELT